MTAPNSEIQCWMRYLFSDEEPVSEDWDGAQEVELQYEGTVEFDVPAMEEGTHSLSPYTLTVARHSFAIPADSFAGRADGRKKLWLQPRKFSGLSLIQNLEWVFRLPEHPIRDDDTQPPLVLFNGVDSEGNPASTRVAPRKSDIFISVADPHAEDGEGALTDFSSGVSETRIGWAVTDTAPSGLGDDEFNVFLTRPFSTSFYVTGSFDLLAEWETKFLSYRVVTKDADQDWEGDGLVTVEDWTARIPDDDTSPPTIDNVSAPEKAECGDSIRVAARITDDLSGVGAARLYWSFSADGSFNEEPYTSIENEDLYIFDIPALGADAVGKTLYFYVEATDGDNDRAADESTSIDENGGRYYTLQVVDTVSPTIGNVNISNGAVVSGIVPITADVADTSGYAEVLVKINGEVTSNSLPFVWNTMIPSWSGPVTIASDTDGWGNSPLIAAGEGRQLWVGYVKEGNLYVTYSPDGNIWNTPVLAARPIETIMRPALLRDASGKLWLAYQDYAADGTMTVLIRYSADNGLTWQSPPDPATEGINVKGTSLIEDEDGVLWYGFLHLDYWETPEWETELLVRLIRSEDGIHWDEPVNVDTNPDSDLYYNMPVTAEGPDGKLHLFYCDWDNLVRSTYPAEGSGPEREPVLVKPEGAHIEPIKIIQSRSGTYWFAYNSAQGSFLAPSPDLIAWADPVIVADTPMAFDVAQSGDGTFWVAGLSGGDVQVFHSSTTEETYAITIEVKDKAGNTALHRIKNVTIDQSVGNGDINNDGGIGLDDAVLAFQVLCGIYPSDIRPDYAVSWVDVNGDEKLGFEEIIYILQVLSDSR